MSGEDHEAGETSGPVEQDPLGAYDVAVARDGAQLPWTDEDSVRLCMERLESAAWRAREAIAEQYEGILGIVEGARDAPDVWVGPDPTSLPEWNDPRGRSVRVVRRERLEFAERAAVADIAVRLGLSEAVVRARAARSQTLARRCPQVWRLFLDGVVEQASADGIADVAMTLPDDAEEAWGAFDDACAAVAARLTPAKVRLRARVIRERVHPESVGVRHERARQERRVWIDAHADGMATLSALLPADTAHRAYRRVDSGGRGFASDPTDVRTLAQRRADVLSDLLVHGAADGVPVTGAPAVAVTVPVMSLLGLDDEPAVLDGYGPIDLDTARRLAGEAASWVRVLTHPVTGTVLDVDRRTYRVPADLRRWLELRHQSCSFPGCRRSSRDCDMDHRLEWHRGGLTSADNLMPVCSSHHRLRHESRWRAESDAGGSRWGSPSGYVMPEDPPPF